MNLFTNALLFDPQNVSTLSLLVAAVAWMVLLCILVADLFTAPSSGRLWVVAWLPVLIALPLIGASIYAVASVIRSWRSKGRV